MTFDGLNLNPFSKIQSDSGKQGFSNMPMLERKAKARLLANQYANEQAIEAAKLGYQSQLDAFKPKETSWGDVAMGVFGSASKAGLFDGLGGGSDSEIFGMPSYSQAKADAMEYDWGSDAGYGGGSSPKWYNYLGLKG